MRNSWFLKVGGAAGLAILLFASGCGFSSGVGGENDPKTSTTYAYVSENGTTNAIAQFQVASDGTLTPLTPATVDMTADGGPAWLVADPSGSYLFASGSYNPLVINQLTISADGTATPNAVPTVNGGDGTHPFIFTPDGKFAIVPGFAANTVNIYSLSVTGTLELVGTYYANELPVSAAVDPSGKYVYVGCVGNGYGSIHEYSIGADGTLTPLSPKYTSSAGEVMSIAVSPKGFLYAVNWSIGTVTAFHIDASTGVLANAGSYQTGIGSYSQPNWIALDASGSYAYVSNQADNSVSQFAVNATTGALTMNAFDVATGIMPFQVAVDPSGKFVYVPSEDGSISLFTISPTGALVANGTLVLGVQYQMAPLAITFAQR